MNLDIFCGEGIPRGITASGVFIEEQEFSLGEITLHGTNMMDQAEVL